MLALIRAEGKAFADGRTLSPEAFVQLPRLQVASKTDDTRRVEQEFKLGDCLYFFAGHACPDFGEVVLVYEAGMADADKGDATPFDTGGLHAGYIRYTSSPVESEVYYRNHRCPLEKWQIQAQAYVRDYFDSKEAYVLGQRPVRDDPTGRLMHKGNERRAWTWEIRIHRDHPIESSLLGIWMKEDYFEELRKRVLLAGSGGARCARLLSSGKVRQAMAPHAAAEAEVARWP